MPSPPPPRFLWNEALHAPHPHSSTQCHVTGPEVALLKQFKEEPHSRWAHTRPSTRQGGLPHTLPGEAAPHIPGDSLLQGTGEQLSGRCLSSGPTFSTAGRAAFPLNKAQEYLLSSRGPADRGPPGKVSVGPSSVPPRVSSLRTAMPAAMPLGLCPEARC